MSLQCVDDVRLDPFEEVCAAVQGPIALSSIVGTASAAGSNDPADRSAQLEMELTSARRQLEDMRNSLPDGLIAWDTDGRIVLCNELYRRLFPHTGYLCVPGALITDLAAAALLAVELKIPTGATAAARMEGKLTAPEYELADGRWIEARGCATSGGTTIALHRDITDRKRMEERVRQLVDAGPTATLLTDGLGRTEFINKHAECTLGWPPEELYGRSMGMVFPDRLKAEQASICEAIFADRVPAPPHQNEGFCVRKDGTEFPVEVMVTRIETSAGPRLVVAISDLSRRFADKGRLEKMQSDLAKLARRTAAGQMATAIAHELNQPLTAITNYIKGARRLIKMRGHSVALLEEGLEAAADQALRAGAIIQSLRNFVGRSESTHVRENLKCLIEEGSVLALVGANENGIQVHFDLAAANVEVWADKVQIQQVILNLTRNAIEAMAHRPTRELTISTKITPNGLVEVSVSDTGGGISSGVVDRLFQPFGSTKKEGMGVGLSICQTIDPIAVRLGRLAGFGPVNTRLNS